MRGIIDVDDRGLPRPVVPWARMPMRLEDLDGRTRTLMLQELERDLALGVLYLSPRLSERGRIEYGLLLRQAIVGGDDATLAAELRRHERLSGAEPRRLPDGRVLFARVPVTAAEMLAEGEVNRFYIRAVCLRALETGGPAACVEVYRAKEVRQPRPESEARIGTWVPAVAVLADLRAHSSEEKPAHGVPGGPNSGLSVRLGRAMPGAGA